MHRRMGMVMIWIAMILASSAVFPASAGTLNVQSNLSWHVQPVDQSSNFRSVSIGIDPYPLGQEMLYYDTQSTMLKEARQVAVGTGNCGSGGNWQCDDKFPTPNLGIYNDMANFFAPATQQITRGIVYYDQGQNLLKYNYLYSGPGGGGAGQFTVIDLDHWTGGSISSQPSLVFDQVGHPHIALVVNTPPVQRLFWANYTGDPGSSCAGLGGSEYWQCSQVEAGANVAAEPSMGINWSGLPYIAYYDAVHGVLKLAYHFIDPAHANCGLNTDWRCVTIDAVGNTGRFPEIVFGDAIYIAYYNYTSGELKLATHVLSGGNCGWDWNGSNYDYRFKCEAIDQVGAAMNVMGLSMVTGGEHPVIAYKDSDDGLQSTVKLAQMAYTLGMDYGNCGPANPFSTWYCQTVAQGPYGLGNEIDLQVLSGGTLRMAFLEADDADQQNHLWYAWQVGRFMMPVVIR